MVKITVMTKIRQEIGIVLGTLGALSLLTHLALMIFTDLARRYHASEIWIVVSVLMTVGGLMLLGTGKK